MVDLQVFYHGVNIKKIPQPIPVSKIQDRLDVTFQGHPNEYYTLLVYDPDAPYPENPTLSPYLHYLAINILGCYLKTGQVIIPYMPPQPPQDSEAHRYLVQVYHQKNGRIGETLDIVTNRENFPLHHLITSKQLVLKQDVVFTAKNLLS